MTCKDQSRWNWTYQLQVKDQIDSFFCFPSIDFRRATGGGYGGFTLFIGDWCPSRSPHGDITLFIGDWYKEDSKARRLNPVASSITATISVTKLFP
ncbi:hypothetical protein BHM03_00052073 [Ensete ventricosum]|nr:hypothetical protein BHM03_00052073 [Ensete ventricosum]